MQPVDAVIGAFAAHRLTRLAVQDTVTAPLRERVFKRWPPTPQRPAGPAYLVSCTWCMGVWAGLAVAALQTWGGRPGQVLVYALALADAVGIAEERL